jgi:ABC-type antimicrobial peptide transport system permease subunit
MNLIDTLRALWRSIVPRHPSDVEEELRSHLGAYQEDLMRHGLSAEEAQRKARIDLGQAATQNETYRDAIGLRPFDELGGDIRYGLRALRRNPGFATVAILSLALGIGATVAMFSLIYAVLLHPFPYADAPRIMNPVCVDEQHPDETRWFATDKRQFETLSEARSIESVLGFAESNMEITGGAIPEDVLGTYLTGNAGSFFGVRALLGRGIEPFDDQGSGQHVAVLNYKFWQRHYGGDPHVIGRTLELDHVPYTIVGVMPRSFAFNDTTGVGDVYLPRILLHDSSNPPVISPYIPWIKLKPHIAPAAADAEINAIVRQFAKENPRHFPEQWHLQLQPIIVPFQQNTARTLYLLLAGVLLLLIIGCANCTILLLARGRARQHELAVRSAIGASRWRIVRQLLVEAVVISFTGAILGVAASYWLAKLPMQLSPASFPQESIIRINLPILAFSVGLALLSGLLFGLLPALRLSHPDIAGALPTRMHGLTAAPAKRRWSALIAAQVALTLLLMATAGTAIRNFLHLAQVPLGYKPNHVMQVGIVMPFRNARQWDSIRLRDARTAYIEQIRQKVAAVPGVRSLSVGVNVAPPYSGAPRNSVSTSQAATLRRSRRAFISSARSTSPPSRFHCAAVASGTQRRMRAAISSLSSTRASPAATGRSPIPSAASFASPACAPSARSTRSPRRAPDGAKSSASSATRATTVWIDLSHPLSTSRTQRSWCLTPNSSSAPRVSRSPICMMSVRQSPPSHPINKSPTGPSISTKPSRATHNSAASVSSPSSSASSPPWRFCSRWWASSAWSPTASRSALRSSASAWPLAHRARMLCGLPDASRSSAQPSASFWDSPSTRF